MVTYNLPYEIWGEVIHWLDDNHLFSVSLVCKDWYQCVNDVSKERCRTNALFPLLNSMDENKKSWLIKHIALSHHPTQLIGRDDENKKFNGPRDVTTLNETISQTILADKIIDPKLFNKLWTSGLFYFEMKVTDYLAKYNHGVGIAIVEENFPLTTFPGWQFGAGGKLSSAYHSDDGTVRFSTDENQNPPFGDMYCQGDTVGIGIDFHRKLIFFTKNSKNFGNAFIEVAPMPWIPSIGSNMKASIHVNFGQEPFRYDLKSYIQSVKNLK